MKPLQATPELLRVARRVMWFEEPERALVDPVQFLAHVMVFGTVEDLNVLRGIVTKDDYREVLEHAPAGVFDVRHTGIWFAADNPHRPCRCANCLRRAQSHGKPSVDGSTPFVALATLKLP